ncbi:Threonine synthase-like 2 [Pseudolycoriella hygida]|uniref:Threonine synthase-like 2 n=1 Tax=Pseudolycoriella hygida TaxID=35572 RepID=A0A9Q0N4H0_9DIPT|nr:Threonine synthase-like 2 [Pseudolycoriella hygida]
MKYLSTRGGITPVNYEQTLFSGYAPDGGLYVPESIPKLDSCTINEWKQSKQSYTQVVERIARMFIAEDEIPNQDLAEAVDRAYEKFNIVDKIGFKNLNSAKGKPFVLAQLYHGQTGSFKDYAMCLVGQLLEYFSRQRNTKTVILVGTSGDTGSAAMEAIKGLKAVDIVVLFPKGKISLVQELQMTSYADKNIHVFAVEGSSDDLDVPIKQCFPRENVTSINSVSWTRVMIQVSRTLLTTSTSTFEMEMKLMCLYLLALLVTISSLIVYFIQKLKFFDVLGNITAGIIARLMGFPINLYCATNANDNVEMFFGSGVYEMGGAVVETPANAMDIRYPYNVERIFYLFTDAQRTANVVALNKSQISPETKDKISNFVNGSLKVETSLINETMKSCWDVNKFVICPHTATAVAYFDQYTPSKIDKNAYIIATATPQKFPESCEEAGIRNDAWNAYALRDSLQLTPKIIPQVMGKDNNWYEMLQEKIVEILGH